MTIEQMFEDSKRQTIPDEKYRRIASLATKMTSIQDQIDELDLVISQLKTQLREVQEQQLPQAMAEVGLSSFKLTTGEAIEVVPFYNASIPRDNPGPALSWLEKNGFGDLIKHKIAVSLGRGKESEAAHLMELLGESGYDYNAELGVHPQTLKAFVKEQIEAGKEVPTELFNVYLGQKAKITRK